MYAGTIALLLELRDVTKNFESLVMTMDILAVTSNYHKHSIQELIYEDCYLLILAVNVATFEYGFVQTFVVMFLISSDFSMKLRRSSSSSLIADTVAYVHNRYFIAFGQKGIPRWRDAPLRLVWNFYSAEFSRKVSRAINACASDMLSMSTSFTKRLQKSKILIRSVP